ncbi:hypothetical protein C8J56DRAFT_805736, partial [Mycena floridula]
MTSKYIASRLQSKPTIPVAQELADLLASVPKLRKENANKKIVVDSHLDYTTEARQAVLEHLERVGFDRERWDHSVKEQGAKLSLLSKIPAKNIPDMALQRIIELGLHLPGEIVRDVRSKFAIVHYDGGKDLQQETFTRCTRLYQCLCGRAGAAGKPLPEGEEETKRRLRQIGWDNIGCQCFIRLVTTHQDEQDRETLLTIDEISGILEHSATCDELCLMSRDPRIPLHPELRTYALSLLNDNIPLTQLQTLCKKWAVKKWDNKMGDMNYRFRLTDHDSSSLYRTIAQNRGIPQRSAAHENLDRWLRPDNPCPPDPLITESIAHYQPCREGVSERLEIIIITPQMREAAWKYGHNRFILTDITFGFCTARASLMTLMVIDSNYKGIPVGFIIFTARPEAKRTSSDYNTVLIDGLLKKYKAALGTNPNGNGQSIEFTMNPDGEALNFSVGITDNDARLRAPLSSSFPTIFLLLCMFHVWQAWRNALNKHLQIIPKGDARLTVKRRLAAFLMRQLKEFTDYQQAIDAYNVEISYFKSLGKKRDDISKRQSKGGLAFLAYFHGYIKLRAFWMSWSKAGAEEAARRLGIPIHLIPRTNNHLEGFNYRIKGKYFMAYLHGGRLPRIDLWILLIILTVMPAFF